MQKFTFTLLFLSLFWTIQAAPEIDNNAGCWTDNFSDLLGIEQANTSSVDNDVFAGTFSLVPGQNSGMQQSTVISPASFDAWQQVCLDATYSGGSDLTIDVLDAATDAVISGYGSIPISSFSNGCYDISGIDVTTYPELKIRINHTRGSTAPVVKQLQVKWNPLTYLLFDKVGPATVLAGEEFRYQVRVSANFTDAKDVVIYDQLPATIDGTVIYEPGEDYGQSDDPVVGQISDDGLYTAAGTTVNGVTIPPHSVYWTFDEISAGVSKVLQIYVKSPNGTLDGTIWENTAEAMISNGENQSAAAIQTEILSTPSPAVSKASSTLSNPVANHVYPINGANYIIAGDLITFSISGGNSFTAEGRERMHNTVMWDDLSDLIDNGLIVGTPLNISGGGMFTAAGTTVNGVTIPPNSIYWDYGTFNPGANVAETFQVQLEANANLQSYTNNVYLDSDQTSVINDNVAVTLVQPADTSGGGGGGGLPSSGCGGSKSHSFPTYSSAEQSGGILFGDPLQYRYTYSNCGAGELEDLVIYEIVPEETEFLDASFSDPSGLLMGTVYYYEELTGTYTDISTPPPFDWTNPNSGGWTTTKPTDNIDPNQEIWVAWHVEGITSPLVNADPTRPTSASIIMDVIPIDPGGNCVDVEINNTILAHVYQTVPDGGGTATVSTDNTDPLYTHSSSDQTTAQSPLGQLDLNLSNGGLSGDLFAPAEVTFSIDVCNPSTNTTAPFVDSELEFTYAGLSVNGQSTVPDFVNVSGGVVTNFDPLNGSITLNLGALLPGDCETASITLFVPAGTHDLANLTVNANVTGEDANCGSVNKGTSASVSSTAVPVIEVYKDDVLNVIGTGENIEYDIFFRNMGEAPSNNTWVVDRIPFKTTFVDAKAPNGEEVWFTNQLPPNMPSNQISVLFPIDFSVISSNFSLGILNDNGTPADFTDDVWTSPFGDQTTWVAFKVDDPTLTPASLPVDINFRKVGFTVTNDDDGTGPNTVGSPEGTVIFNEEVIFSDQNLMAVGNEVRTTIIDAPGLVMDKKSTKEVVNTGEAFDWTVEYYNNSSFQDDIVRVTDTIPAGFTLNTISHEWNATAGGGGASDITSDPNVTITNNPNGSTTVEILVAGSPGLKSNLLTQEGGKFYFSVTVGDDMPCGALVFNEVSGYAQNMGGALLLVDADPVTVYNPDVYLTKSVSQEEALSGETITYTLGFGNRGLIEAPGVIIRDTLPAGFTYVAGSTSLLSAITTVSEPTITGNVIEWNDFTVLGNPTGVFPANYSNNYLTFEAVVTGANGTTHINHAGISTTSPEKLEHSNIDSALVVIPHPDPMIRKVGPAISASGETVVWELSYLNKNNAVADNVYIIESLPDADANGADVTFTNTITDGPGTVTAYYTATSGTAPAFDPNSPTTGGWSASPTSPVNHIAYVVGTLPPLAGPYTIQVMATLLDGVDGSEPIAGAQFLNQTAIFTSSVDTDLTNNTDEVITRTPGVDLAIRKTGSLEGAFPGARPGDDIEYTITVENTGTIDAYGISIEDILPPNFIPDPSNFDDFITVEIYDANGNLVPMLDENGNPVSFTVPVTEVGTPSPGGTTTWYLGSTNPSDPDYYRNLAIPPGGSLNFTITGTIDETTPDGDISNNQVSVTYEGLPSNTTPEEFLDNNMDNSQVTIWRPDVTIKKTVVNEPDGDETWTEAGSILVYNLEYNNIGNADADNTCIQEIIPPGTSYVAGSLTLPPGGTVSYSPDATNPTSFEMCLPVLPAPPNYDAEAAPYDSATGGTGDFDGTDPNSIACPERVPAFPELNADAFPNASSGWAFGAAAGDLDGDGDLDVLAARRVGQPEQLWLNDGTGNFTLGFTFPVDDNSTDVDFGDFDADGDLDVVFAAQASVSTVYENDGSGNFTVMTSVGGSSLYAGVDIGDFNADGIDDVAIASQNPIRVYISNGDGTFASPQSIAGVTRAAFIEAADFNGDGYDDLAAKCGSGCDLGVVSINNQDGTWTSNFFAANGQGSVPGDYNGDGNLDFATSQEVWYGDGTGNMTFGQNFGGFSAASGVAVDYDQDGDLDIVFASGLGGVKYASNNGDGTFTIETIRSGRIINIDAGDFDGDGFIDVVAPNDNTSGIMILNNTFAAPYVTNSYYETTVNTSNISSWDKLLVDHTVAEGASIEYLLYDVTADDDGNVTNDTPLFGPQTLSNGYADISAIPASTEGLILRVNITSDGVAKACLHNWTATYISPDIPSIEFKVRVDDPVTAGQLTVDNTVSITTTTPEIRTDNNDSEDNINIRLTDLAITKSVDKSAVQAPGDETITYTLDWEVLGPQSAINAMVHDVLPANVSYQSAVPAPTFAGMTASGRDSLVWNLGASLNVGTMGSIVVTTQETSAVAGDNLTNVTWIENDRQETDYDNNNDDALTIVGDFANVYIEKDGSSVVDINGTGQYQLTYGNNGNIAADNVVVMDDLPAGFTPTMTDNAACTVAGQNVTCNFGALAVGATGTVLVDFQVANDPNLIGQTLNNIANITTTTPETDISDNNDDHDIPIFLLELASLGGTVWHDDNRDGVIDPSESGIDSVMIILTGLDIFGASVQDTAWTDTNGEYSFAGLIPGTYNVEEVQPQGYLTITTTGTDSVTDIGDVVETSNSPQTTRTDDGTVGGGTTSPMNEAFNSITLNGGDRGIEYNFGEDLGIIGDTVWVDNNVNGLQDAGEPPVAGVTVRLYQDLDMDGILNPALDNLVETTVTNTLGAYLFEDLFADNYFVDFDLTTLPDSLNRVTLQNAGGDDSIDSDADPVTGYTELIMLPAGGEDLTWDMGVYGDLLIGNYVWLDTNKDGIQDAGESPLEGVNVTLFNNMGDSLTTVQTDMNGLYYFNTDTLMNAGLTGANSILAANTDYYIVVGTGGQFDTAGGTLLNAGMNYQLTIDSTGTMETDSDAELANGLGLGFDGLPFTLITTPDFNQVDTTFDFGFISPVYDYGDLPDTGVGTATGNYATSMASNGPSHLIVTGLLLGATIDEETDGQSSATAEGDDTDDGNDDEDGLILPTIIIPGGSEEISITTTNDTGERGYVRVWIDWNNDGDFDDANEMVVDDGVAAGTATNAFTVTAPNDTPIGAQLGVRVRLSNQAGLTSVGPSNSGEVEDYLITTGSYDFPDFESPCNTPPCHIVGFEIYLGSGVTSETTSTQNSTADGDTDDGLLLSPNFNAVPGNDIHFPLSVFNNTGETAYIAGWADWNGNGDFEDAGEQFISQGYDAATYNGAFIVNLPVTIPTDVSQTGGIAVRFRVSTDDTIVASPCGVSTCATDGEVEDYFIQIECKSVICPPVQLTIKDGNP